MILSCAVALKILQYTQRPFTVGTCTSRGGFGYLKKTIRGFNHAAKGTPYLVLTDLDNAICPLALIQEWLPFPKHPHLLLRIAVREVEAWLLAHREAVAKFFGIRLKEIPITVEILPKPKQCLIELASKSRHRHLRKAIVPRSGSTAKVGRAYNDTLIDFVNEFWEVEVAMDHSPSLKDAVNAVLCLSLES